jgi:hypothetical protein
MARANNGDKFMKTPIGRLAIAAAMLTLAAGASHADQSNSDVERAAIGFRIAPVPLDLRRLNKSLVGQGSYLMNAAGGCNDCHTHPNFAPGGDPFAGEPEAINVAGYMRGGREFGPTTSPNITPQGAQRLPAGLTWEQFLHALRTGQDPDQTGAPAGHPKLLQVMPWNVYGKLAERDLRAIYEYLRSIPALPDNPNPGP